jgi:hypothetical protein
MMETIVLICHNLFRLHIPLLLLLLHLSVHVLLLLVGMHL